MTRKQRKNLIRIVVSILLTIIIVVVDKVYINNNILSLLLFIIPYIVIGYDILFDALRGIKNRQMFDENFLMTTATIGALVIGYIKTGDYLEAIAVMIFYQIGELFQSIAVGKSRKNIANLMDIKPDSANLIEGENILITSPEDISIGSLILVRPGEKIPLDGIITKGGSSLNTSALTGESLPKDITEGDEVLSGCINLSGVIEIKTTKVFGEATVSKILDLVSNATNKKSKSEKFISKFSKVYTPFVCISALLLAFIPPVVMFLINKENVWSEWIYRALTFLVISCPCALVISIPLTFFSCIGGASKAGVLVKGSNYLEALSKAKYVVFDKTGTLTKGVFSVSSVITNNISEEDLLEYASLAESYSLHPIALSIIKKYGKDIDLAKVNDYKEIAGEGIVAKVLEKKVYCGNNKLMERFNIEYEKVNTAFTCVYVAIDEKYSGCIIISDEIKETSLDAVSLLKANGISEVIMLTGDNKNVSQEIAKKLKIDKIYSELLPNEKVKILEDILNSKNKSESVVFVGDGINDAPVIGRADIGIAMGAIGSDAAIEASDVVLMDDDPIKVSKSIRIAKKCMRIVYQNIIFALSVKTLCLILGALGVANMWLAIFADVGVMVLAVLNSIRALSVSKL